MSEPLSVSQITRQLKDCLEGAFPLVAVRGEVSSSMRAASGHVYLTLKDEQAQLRTVIWKRTAQRIKFDIADGIEVVAIGAIELYPARGTYQLVVQELIPEGIGPLELAFRQLHDKLAAEGLFEPGRKRPLPRYPRRIALITSPTGAAIRDMLQVITRRWRGADVVVVPVPVQGDCGRTGNRGRAAIRRSTDQCRRGRRRSRRAAVWKTCGRSTKRSSPGPLPPVRCRSSVRSGMKSTSRSPIWWLTAGRSRRARRPS